MGTSTRARYTLEFKLEALRLAKTGQNIAATAKILGLSEQADRPPPGGFVTSGDGLLRTVVCGSRSKRQTHMR